MANIEHLHSAWWGIKAEGFSIWGIIGIWAAQLFAVWEAPPKSGCVTSLAFDHQVCIASTSQQCDLPTYIFKSLLEGWF